MHEENKDSLSTPKSTGSTRRTFLQQVSLAGAAVTLNKSIISSGLSLETISFRQEGMQLVKMTVNGKTRTMEVDPRMTLLDALRENVKLTGTKKGCDRGQCGACTVLMDGKRVNSCLILAAMCEGKQVTTIEGIGTPEKLHPMQAAFLKHDAFQCGYCTPGQICSAIAMLQEGHANTDEQIKEDMSGNLCRCGAYQNILDAIKEVAQHA